MDIKNLELRSNVVQEILGYTPPWVLRWGITSILAMLLLLLYLTWFIKYPDAISGRVTITTETPPIRVVTESSGVLELFVEDGQYVEKETLLAWIQNPAQRNDVQFIKEELKRFYDAWMNRNEREPSDFRGGLRLGELQPAYSAFLKQYIEYTHFKKSAYYEKTIQSLKAQVKHYQALNTVLLRQRRIMSDELKLAEKQFKRDKVSFEKGLVSELELQQSEQNYFAQQRAAEAMEERLINNTLTAEQHQQRIEDLTKEYKEKQRRLHVELNEAVKQMESQLTAWEQRYLLKALISGRVSFFRYWSDQQYVRAGEDAFIVVPDLSGLIGRMIVNAEGAGKIQVGQTANIKCHDYPFKEYGALIGVVTAIAPVALGAGSMETPKTDVNSKTTGSGYIVQVGLPDGLTTTHKKKVDFKQGMTGQVDIVTQKRRLIQRFFDTLFSLFRETGA